MDQTNVLDRIAQLKIVPITSMDSAEAAPALADALVGGGLPIVEITFRTAAAEKAIASLAKRSDILVGAGTVLNVETVKKAMGAGAKFIVSPGLNPKVVSYCVGNGIPITPGTCTPSDLDVALEHGLKVVKFFPCESIGGLKTLKAIAAPYNMMKFLPTGGIGPELLGDYLKFAPVLAVGGSWMASRELISAGKFGEITTLARQAVQIANTARAK